MKNTKKLGLSVASFGVATMCLVGGTFAWYVVSNTGTATISGTTAKVDGELTMGIKPHTLEGAYALLKDHRANYKAEAIGNLDIDPDNYTFEDDETFDSSLLTECDDIYWNYQDVGSNVKGNQIGAAALTSVFYNDGYTDRKLEGYIEPLTSRSFVEGSGIDGKNPSINLFEVPDGNALAGVSGNYDSDTTIYDAPEVVTLPDEPTEEEQAAYDQYLLDLAAYNEKVAQMKGKYISFTLVFNANGNAGQEIYLENNGTQFVGGYTTNGQEMSADHDVVKTLRVSFESATNNYIYAPSNYYYDVLRTPVGGYLDLNADGVRDYNSGYVKTNENFIQCESLEEIEAILPNDVDKQAVYYYVETTTEEGEEGGEPVVTQTKHAYAWSSSAETDNGLREINANVLKKINVSSHLRIDHKWYGEHEDLPEGAKLTDPEYSVLINEDEDEVRAPVLSSNKDAFGGVFATTDGSAFGALSYKFSDLVQPKYQNARGLDYFIYHENNSNNHPIAITDENGYAEVTIKIWTEGWSRDSVNGKKAPFTGTMVFEAPNLIA